MPKIYRSLIVALILFSVRSIAQPVIGMTTFYTTTTTALAANTSCSITKTVTLSGWLFSVQSTSNCGFNWTSTTGGDGRLQYLVGFGTLTQATFGSDDGSEFALQSLTWGVSTSSWTSKPMEFVGYKNGIAVPGATFNTTTPSGTGILNTLVVNFSMNPAFNDVDEVRLAPNTATCNSILFFEDITIGTPSATCVTPTVTVQSSNNVLCNGGSTGSAAMSASGGAPFTYTWSPSGGNASSAIGLSSGIYTCAVTNSCGVVSSQTVMITEPPSALASSTAVTNAPCNGSMGSGTITLSGGTAPYTYTWSSGPTTSVEPTLLAGTYTVRGTDANGCTITRSVSVTEPAGIITSTSVTNVLCNGGTGSASVSASGGAGGYTYAWSAGSTSSSQPGLLAGTYTVKVTDANGCSVTRSVSVTQPSALVTSTAITNILCNGGTGSATISASGGTGPYTYTWSASATSSVQAGLLAGTYTVKVIDANNCSATKSVTISQPSALVSSTAVTNPVCNGGIGSATITLSGGTGAYSYTWSSGPTTSVEPTLLAGTYTVRGTDSNTCSVTSTVTISQPPAIATSTAYTNILCNGGSTGSGSISASGGIAPYTYTWSTGATTSVITNVPAGSYTVKVIDANNCSSVTRTITITQPSAIVTATSVTNVLCNGGNGSATVTASGGVPAYTYSWSSGATTSVVTLPAGTYTVRVTDLNTCSKTTSVTISQPAALVTATAVANALCNGGNGSGTISASGGTGAYTYSWSTGATTSVTSLPAGVHTATVTDANGCSAGNTVTVSQPALALTTSTAVTNVLCNGGNGSATISASGGTGTYTYSWSTAATTSVISGIPAGVYTATVTDANACTSIKSITISQPSALITSTAVTNVLCNGGNGSATITASGGTGAYTYSWSAAATASVVSGLPAGAYTATVTDANSCTSVKSITISQPAALMTSTAITNVLCLGGNNGSATVTASGGTGAYTYSWSTTATASVITGQTAGVKTVTVTDANGCTANNTVTITQPASGLTATVVTANVLCNGGNTGSATVMASGGIGAYTYLWSTSATTSIITSQIAGVKTVTVTDANGCTAINISTITEPGALTTSTAIANVLCNGGNTGSATVTANGGTPGYSYLWSTSATASVITGETAGIKTVTVTDANGCMSTNTVTITEPTALTTSTVIANVLCNGGNTGSATVTATGGTPGYAYLWSTSATASVITGETAGVKTVTVTDANGCMATNTISITEPTALTTSTAIANVLCNGGNTGSATITANGGTPGYIYLWSTSATASVITGETAGVKTVTVTDANGCMAINTVTITEPVALSTSTNVSNVLCNGGNTGSATITANGGTPGYTYLWSTSATTSVITGETAGVKTVTVTDVNGCVATNTLTITEPAALSTSTSVSNVLCNGGNTGSATITAAGGTPGYTYLWSTSATTSVITGESAGIKTVTVTDANGCITTNTVTVAEPVSALATSTAIANVLCNGGNTGSATVTATGGTPGYIYLWSTSATASVITGETAGIKTVTVTDANGCTTTNTVNITEPTTLATSTTVNNVLCNGGNTGSATVTVNGGAPGYAYLWSTSATTSVITSETTGVKTVTVTDANGCTIISSVAITEPTALTTSTAVANVLCNGGNTGSATITATGGTPGYTYLWSTSATASVITSETAGVKTATVTDANGCMATNTVTINEPATGLTATISVNNVLCNGGNTGSATVTATGGTAGYTYLWSTAVTASVITGETAGIKTVTVTDANGCTTTETTTITEPSPIVTSVTVNNVLCNGGNNGSATVTANGGTAGYTYLWSTSATTSVITGETAGVKTVTVTDANGCTSINIATITEPSALTAAQTQTNVTCIINGIAEVSVSGGTGPYSYTWSPLGGNAATSSTLTAGNYTCTITDANNCTMTSLFTITANTVNPVVSLGADIEVTSGSSYQFSPLQTGVVSYSWSPGTYLSSVSVIDPITSPETDITYILTVTASNGCTASDTVMVKVKINELIIANYMSPNGDGVNDTWKVNAPSLIKDFSVDIFDSYGKTVFNIPNNYNNEFDGKLGGQDLPDGVYYYFIKDGNTVKHKGSITLTK